MKFFISLLAITPLFLAARGGNLELTKALLKKGADPNKRGAPQLLAPLHWAAHKEHTDIAILLIGHGADVQLKDKENRTPLSFASPELSAKMLGETQKIKIQCHFQHLQIRYCTAKKPRDLYSSNSWHSNQVRYGVAMLTVKCPLSDHY